MPLIQGGPPEWIWERTPDPLQWEVTPSQAAEGQTVFELRVNCGLAIMRLHFFTEEEIRWLRTLIEERLDGQGNGARAPEKGLSSSAPVRAGRASENQPEPGSQSEVPDAGWEPQRKEGVVSDPDFVPAP